MRRARAILLTVLGGIVFILIAAAFVPVTLVASGGVSAESISAGVWERDGQPTRSTVTVTALDGPLVVRPSLVWPQVMNPALVTSGQQPDETAAYRVRPGTPLVIEGVFADLTLTPVSGTGTAQRDGTTVEVAGQPVTVDSAAERFTRTTSMMWRTIPADLQDPAAAALRASVANTDLDLAGQDSVPLSLMAGPAVRTVLSGVAVFLGAGVLLVLMWLFGRALDPAAEAGPGRDAARMLLGAGLAMTGLNTLAYVVPVRVAAPLLLVLIALVVAVRWWRKPLTGLADSARTGLRHLGLAGIAALILFFPVLIWGPTYVGEYKTDIFEYATLAGFVRDNSLIHMRTLPDAATSGPLTSGAGFSWRSIDSVMASGLSVLGISTIAAFAVAFVVLFLIFAVCLLALRSMTGGGRWALAITFLTLLAPALTGLMTEDYYSQYFLLAFVPGLLVTGWLALDDAERAPRWYLGFLGWALAAVLAVMAAAYPYFLAILLVGVVVAVVVSKARLLAALRMLPVLALQAIVLTNLALLTVLNFAQTEQYQDGLNAIARNVLLAGYSTSDQVLLVAGFEPWQWRYAEFGPIPAMGVPGAFLWRMVGTTAGSPLPGLLLIAVTVVVGLAAVRWKASLRSFAFTASVAMIGAWALFSLYFGLSGGTYTAFKGVWTAAVLLPLPFATAHWRPRVVPVLTLVLAVVSVFWLRTIVADRLAWVITRDAVQTAPSHQAIQPELDDVRALLRPGDTLAIVTGDEPLVGSDRDRVALAQLRVMAKDAGVECTNCTAGTVEDALACVSSPTSEAPDVIISIGATGREELCGRSLIYDGQFIEVYT